MRRVWALDGNAVEPLTNDTSEAKLAGGSLPLHLALAEIRFLGAV